MSEEKLLTKDEVAAWLGMKRRTVLEWGARGFLPRIMVEGVQFHKQSDVAAWIESQKVSA